MKLHDKIKQLRKSKKISQAELAEITGTHMTHISRLETGKFKPASDLLSKLAAALDVTMEYLLDDNADSFTPVKTGDKTLIEKIRLIEQLDPEEKDALMKIIDALLTKKKFVDLVQKETFK